MNIDKRKMRKALYIYVTLMMVLLFSSKTIYNYSLPKVSVAEVVRGGTLIKEYETSGVMEFSESYDLYAATSGQIDKMLVAKGDVIDAGTQIATLRSNHADESLIAALEENVKQAKNQLDRQKLQKSNMGIGEMTSATVEAERTATSNAVADAKINLERAEMDLTDVQNEVNVKKEIAESTGDSQAQENVQNARRDLTKAENAVVDARIALERAEINFAAFQKMQSEQTTQLQKEREFEAANVELGIKEAEIALESAKRQLQEAKQSEKGDISIFSEYAGIVTSVGKKHGEMVLQGENVATIGVDNGVFVCDIVSLEEDVRFVDIGDEATIVIKGVGYLKATITEITLTEGSLLRIRLNCETDWPIGGEYVSVRFQKEIMGHDILIPNEALGEDVGGKYVWILKSRKGTLGTEYYVSKNRITVADSDDYYTAVGRGMEMQAEPVITGFDKPLQTNGRVRRME